MRKMGIWEILGIFAVVIPFAWYACMDGFKRKSCNTPHEKDEKDEKTPPSSSD